MSVSIKWKGINQLEQGLKPDLIPIQRIVRLNGAELQQKAQRNAPVDTGTLRRSIDLQFADSNMTAIVAAHTEYAAYVEYGTRFMLPRRYMGKAYDVQLSTFENDLSRLGFRR